MGSSGFVPHQCALEDALGDRDHVLEGLGEDHVLVGPVARIGQRASLRSLDHGRNLFVSFGQLVVVSDDRCGAGHDVAEFLVEQVGILSCARGVREELFVPCGVLADGSFEDALGKVCGGLVALHPVDDSRADKEPGEDATQEGVCSQAICAVVLVIAFSDRVEARDIGRLVAGRAGQQSTFAVGFVVDPKSTHAVVDGREDLHGLFARIDALEFLVDLQDATELAIQLMAWDVGQV